MDSNQFKDHLKILASRVSSLENELKAAVSHNREYSERKKNLQEGLKNVESNRIERSQNLELKYGSDIDEYKKQIKLAEDVLVKKKEERQAMVDYLISLELIERSHNDLKDFDWISLQRLAENMAKPSEDILTSYGRLEEVNELFGLARENLDEIQERISSIEIAEERLKTIVQRFQANLEDWKRTRCIQENKVRKLQSDNEKLNLLLRQCVTTSEPLSDYVTKTVHAKCHSFINCDINSNELLEGLKKFKTRQDRIIQLLRHKDAKLGSETNKLQVACDQTHDQLKFYVQLIEQHRNIMLNRSRIQQVNLSNNQISDIHLAQSGSINKSGNQTCITDYYVPRAKKNLTAK